MGGLKRDAIQWIVVEVVKPHLERILNKIHDLKVVFARSRCSGSFNSPIFDPNHGCFASLTPSPSLSVTPESGWPVTAFQAISRNC